VALAVLALGALAVLALVYFLALAVLALVYCALTSLYPPELVVRAHRALVVALALALALEAAVAHSPYEGEVEGEQIFLKRRGQMP